VFVAIHVGAIYLDSFVHFTPRQLVVPFASTWRPHAVAWGIFATYLLLAIQVTSWAMRRMPRKLWHRVHMLSFPMLLLATVHGFLAGTDRSNRAVQWIVLAMGLVVVFLVSVRLLSLSRGTRAGSEAATVTVTRDPNLGRTGGAREEIEV